MASNNYGTIWLTVERFKVHVWLTVERFKVHDLKKTRRGESLVITSGDDTMYYIIIFLC